LLPAFFLKFIKPKQEHLFSTPNLLTMKKSIIVLALLLWSGAHLTYGQGSELYGPGLKLKVNEDGSKYVRFIIWNQIWARSIQNNPGTTVNGRAEQTSLDIGARRARILAYAQVSPRYLVLTHFGINNQTFVNGGAPGGGITGNPGPIPVQQNPANGALNAEGISAKKPGLFFHDIWNEYTVFSPVNLETGEKNNFSMAIGAGLHYWHGTSRLTNASTLNFLAIDAPIFNWHTIELSDQFARQFGVYTKGKVGKIDYRFNLSKPFITNLNPPAPGLNGPVAVDNNVGSTKPVYAGYASYQFFDQEANVLPFAVGSYLGTKRVFNIGAGFHLNPEGTASRAEAGGPLQKHDIRVLSTDIFADLPFGSQGMAVTAYGVLYNFNYGPNYLRHVGIMNVGTFVAEEGQQGYVPPTQRSISGPGNGRTLFGTGNTFYTQAGLLLPRNTLGVNNGKLQPFAAYTFKQIDALPNNGHYYDLGFNYLVDGHHAKLTFQYSSRPVHIGTSAANSTLGPRRGEFIIQSHIYL
jgi:hypothetical protein